MATTGTKLQVAHVVNTSGATVGQGSSPELVARFSYSDASVSTPTWTDVTADVRAFSTSRGRENELAEVDAGTCTLVLDNRDRAYDPFVTGIRPLSRVWLQEQFTGETQSIFVGYIESVDNQWSVPVGDAECVVQCADEYKVLALDALDVSDPPRDIYPEVVKYDEPQGYWIMADDDSTKAVRAEVGGKDLLWAGTGVAGVFDSPIKGDPTPAYHTAALQLAAGSLTAKVLDIGEPGDFGNASSFIALEIWFKIDAIGADTTIVLGPLATAAEQYQLLLNASGTVTWKVQDNGGTMRTVTSVSPLLEANRWYHLVGTLDLGNLGIYINGALSASTSFGGGVVRAVTPNNPFYINGPASGNSTVAHFATYVHYLTAERIFAHYEAGAALGLAQGPTGTRINDVLDKASSLAPRSVQAGSRNISAVYEHGQDPLSELRQARVTEAVDALLFVARDGTLTFLADGHRSSSPYNTVQATFDDDGTDLPYEDLDVDYSESFLYNEINGTRTGGLLQSVSDATSIARYFKRSLGLTGLLNVSEANVLTIVTALLAKYAAPMTRIQSLALTTDTPAVTEAVFRQDIGTRIRVFRTPPGGGARLDHTLFIQKISVAGANDGKPWQISLAVSPL